MNRVIWCTPNRADEVELISAVTASGCLIVRRCLEAVDLLAAAGIESDAVVVVDAAVPRLGSDIVASIEVDARRPGRVIGLIDDDSGATAARALGIRRVVDSRSPDLASALVQAISESSAGTHLETDSASSGTASARRVNNDDASAQGRGSIVAVTGPPGAPGRTTVSIGLAEAWAQRGERVCLVDADTVAPSLAATVGITEDVSGVLLASRYAEQGALDARSLGSSCRRMTDRLWVLTGIGTADRWTGVRASVLERIWSACASHFDRVVIDAGTLLDTPAVDDPFGAGTERDAATISALRSSDATVAVTHPEAIGVLRLVQQFPLIRKHAGDARVHVVVNRHGRRDQRTSKRVADALLEAGMPVPVHTLREDASIRSCVQRGALLGEVAATMKARRAFGRLSRELVA